jgi:hypothetical protein
MKLVLGLFDSRLGAEDAINELENSGFNAKDISIMMRSQEDTGEIQTSTGNSVGEGLAKGVGTGAVIGAIAGLLIGTSAVVVPGIGALLIGGPISAALGLTGAAASTVTGAVTGGVAGGLVGALVGLGIPEEDARVYETRIREGAILVAVPSSLSMADKAESVLTNNGATQIKLVDQIEDRPIDLSHERGFENQPVYFSEIKRK